MKGDVQYRDIAERVFLLTDVRKRMKELGETAPGADDARGYRKYRIMGKEFDPAKPEAYVDSFAIRKLA